VKSSRPLSFDEALSIASKSETFLEDFLTVTFGDEISAFDNLLRETPTHSSLPLRRSVPVRSSILEILFRPPQHARPYAHTHDTKVITPSRRRSEVLCPRIYMTRPRPTVRVCLRVGGVPLLTVEVGMDVHSEQSAPSRVSRREPLALLEQSHRKPRVEVEPPRRAECRREPLALLSEQP